MGRPKKTTKTAAPSRLADPETSSPAVAQGEGVSLSSDSVEVEVPGTSPLSFNAYDRDLGSVVEMRLVPGRQSVSRAVFEVFEADEFFSSAIIGGDVVRVLGRPARSVDVVDI